jgi:nitrogen-specific signal transduction histidine kinase
MALEELPEESNLRFDIEQINSAANRGKDLVQQILTFSREVDFKKKPIRIQPIIAEVLNLIKASLPPNVEIKQSLDPGIGSVFADPTQIHQVLMNLCTNANHAMMKTGGVLEVIRDYKSKKRRIHQVDYFRYRLWHGYQNKRTDF